MRSILIEAGGGSPPSDVTVQPAVTGVRNVLRRLGPVEETVEPTADPRVLHGFRIVTSSRAGFVTDGVSLGDEVRVGDELARVIDAYGDVVEEIEAPVAGVVLTAPVNPAAGTGTWAYEIGW